MFKHQLYSNVFVACAIWLWASVLVFLFGFVWIFFLFRLQQKSVSINVVLIEFDRNNFRSDSSSFRWLAHGHHLQCKKSEIQTSTSNRTYITFISQFTLSSFGVHIFDYVINWTI